MNQRYCNENEEILSHWYGWQGVIDCETTKKPWTAKELVSISENVAAALEQQGIQQGDIVAFVFSNSVAFPVFLMATLMIKSHPLLLHVGTPLSEIENMASDIGIQWIMHDFQEGFSRISPTGFTRSNELSFGGISVGLKRSEQNEISRFIAAEGVCLHPSSGTYGSPRVCIRNQKVAICEAANYTETVTAYRNARVHITTPLNHAYAYGFGLMSALITDSTLVLAPSFNPKSLLRREKENPSDILAIVPPMANLLVYLKKVDPTYKVPPFTFYAGTRCDEQVIETFEKTFGSNLFTIFGTTETGAISTDYMEGNASEGVGSPFGRVRLNVSNTESYSDLGDNIGEIRVASSSMMQGYFKEEKEIDYHPTGDIGYLDDEGNIHLVGRIRDIINVGGTKIDPSKVENCLFTHPAIGDCAVYPGKSQAGEEVVQAAIELKDSGVEIRTIKQFCYDNLNAKMVPSRFFVVEKLPRTPSGKCLKIQLPEYNQDLIRT